jgi:hypothetical protein
LVSKNIHPAFTAKQVFRINFCTTARTSIHGYAP